jgi:hypothetical protein
MYARFQFERRTQYGSFSPLLRWLLVLLHVPNYRLRDAAQLNGVLWTSGGAVSVVRPAQPHKQRRMPKSSEPNQVPVSEKLSSSQHPLNYGFVPCICPSAVHFLLIGLPRVGSSLPRELELLYLWLLAPRVIQITLEFDCGIFRYYPELQQPPCAISRPRTLSHIHL